MEEISSHNTLSTLEEIKTYTKNNQRLTELFSTKPTTSIDVYKKTTYFFASKKYEEYQLSSEAIPHGFYAILEKEIIANGFLKTIKKYEKEIKLISEIMNIEPSTLISILKNLKPNNTLNQDTAKEQEARNSLKEIFHKFTAKYKERYIKRIYNQKMELLEQNVTKSQTTYQYQISKEEFISLVLNNKTLIEALTAIISKHIGIIPNNHQIKAAIQATFAEDYITELKRVFGIQKPPSFSRFEANKYYVRLKRNYEPKLNKVCQGYSEEEKEKVIKILEIKIKIKELIDKGDNLYLPELNKSIQSLKALISHENQIILEEISTIMYRSGSKIQLVNGRFVFDIESKVTKEESITCKEYIALEKKLKRIHNFVLPMYIAQNKIISTAITKSPTPLSTNNDGYTINTDIWFNSKKIIKVIDSLDIEKINSMSKENYEILKDFLINKGLLWAYMADNIDINTFLKIINNFESIIACCKKEDIKIENLHEIIRKANLYDYANDLIIGLVGLDVTAKVINYNQFSGVTITDEVIKKRLLKLVDLAVRSEQTTKSSLPFGCNVKIGNYSLQRYKNNDPQIFTSGIDTKTCFFISVNENDFFFYSLLNKNGYTLKIVNQHNELIARASCFRKNNILMINGIRCKNNKVHPESQEETKEMLEIIRLIELMSKKLIELTTQDECPIDYIVCNKAGILENSELESHFTFEYINTELFREPINIYDEDWQEFIHLYDNEPVQLLQQVSTIPDKSFTTDFGGHYPALLIASRNNMALTSPRDISLKDQPATYTRPRKSIEEYISAELTDELIARINRIRALSCFTGTQEEQQRKKDDYTLIKDKNTIKSIIIGDDWCIIIYPNNTYDVYFTNYNKIAQNEIKGYIERLQETMNPKDIEDLTQKGLIPEMKDGVKIYKYQKKS